MTISEIIKFEPDAIIIIDAGIAERTRKDGTTIRWEPTAYNDETANFQEVPDPTKPVYAVRKSEQGNFVVGCGGGKARCIAAARLYDILDVPIVTTSKYPLKGEPGHQPPDEHWKVYQDYLRGTLHIPNSDLLAEEESTTTITGILNLIFMAYARGWKRALMMVNDFHLPRTRKFYEYLTDRSQATTLCKHILARIPVEYRERMDYVVQGTESEPEIIFASDRFTHIARQSQMMVVSAESVLHQCSDAYTTRIRNAENSYAYQMRVKMEQRGVDQLDAGNYMKPIPTPQPFPPTPTRS